MEERTLKDEEARKIKLKRTKEGAIDAVEETGEEDEEEISLELGEVDEDYAGLSPEETEALMKKREKAREKARAECAKLLAEGERLLGERNFSEAEAYFSQALLYDPDEARAQEAIWICRTKNFKDLEAFYALKNAEEFSALKKELKEKILSKVSQKLMADRAEYEAEAAEKEGGVYAAQKERRAAFQKNRNYYLLRFSLSFAAFALFLAGALIGVYFITRSKTIIPAALAIAFGAAALVCLFVVVFFSRKLYEAQSLVKDNEKLSSTGDGARLEFLQKRLMCLKLIFDDGEEEA